MQISDLLTVVSILHNKNLVLKLHSLRLSDSECREVLHTINLEIFVQLNFRDKNFVLKIFHRTTQPTKIFLHQNFLAMLLLAKIAKRPS